MSDLTKELTTLLTPREFVLKYVLEYPSLFAKNTFEESSLAVFDQIFNTIGNGIELSAFYTASVDEELALSYINERIYYAYKEIEGCDWFDQEPTVIKESELNNPAFVKTIEIKKNKDSFYPNFQSKYSIFENIPEFLDFGVEWLESVKWFYQQAQNYFLGNCSNYLFAYPCSTQEESDWRIRDMEDNLGKYKSNEEISEAYGCEYDGDIDKFQRLRWEREKTKILTFLGETLEMLDSKLVGVAERD